VPSAQCRHSGYDPEYRIRRADHKNWRKNLWSEKDWTALLQAQWKNTRQAVLRRRAEAEAHAKAEQIEADMVKKLPAVHGTKYVKRLVEESYTHQAKT
jgi:hypothetical protein